MVECGKSASDTIRTDWQRDNCLSVLEALIGEIEISMTAIREETF